MRTKKNGSALVWVSRGQLNGLVVRCPNYGDVARAFITVFLIDGRHAIAKVCNNLGRVGDEDVVFGQIAQFSPARVV